jgi:hypothetical protein
MRALYYRNLEDLYVLIQLAGWQGTWEDFLKLNMGQVMGYARIALVLLTQVKAEGREQ